MDRAASKPGHGCMDYQFTILTVSQRITVNTEGINEQAPWSNLVNKTISMPGATLSTITISDDDGSFHSGRYGSDVTGQTLTTAVTFGTDAQPTPAGTRLSFHINTIIQSTTANANGSLLVTDTNLPQRQHPQEIPVFPKLLNRCF